MGTGDLSRNATILDIGAFEPIGFAARYRTCLMDR
jgi:hypothetical protein